MRPNIPALRLSARVLPALVGTLLALPVLAQTVAPAPDAPRSPAASAPGDRIERITNEDALTRIQELRVGGQTQSIDVEPKNGAPAYQIAPQPAGALPGETGGKPTGNAGRSSWRVLSF
jgi:hypothetical protein